jgi:hypothetical protein
MREEEEEEVEEEIEEVDEDEDEEATRRNTLHTLGVQCGGERGGRGARGSPPYRNNTWLQKTPRNPWRMILGASSLRGKRTPQSRGLHSSSQLNLSRV